MRYVTIAELSDMIRQNLWKIPQDIDLVVGIPRSGLMVANMIALYLNKRLTDIDSFINGYTFKCGERGNYICNETTKKVLVIDDSVCSGSAMTKAKAKLNNQYKKFNFIFASPIVTTEGRSFVDIFFEVIDEERIFEWNLFHHSYLESSCFDIDCMLFCKPEEYDDEEKYLDYLKNAKPLFTPTVIIDSFITCRHEKYRKQTEEWLRKNNISFRHLVMLGLSGEKRIFSWKKQAVLKGSYYKKNNCLLFIESSLNEATIIAKKSNKPVICIETNELLYVSPRTRLLSLITILKGIMPRTYYLLQRIIRYNKNNL